MMRSLFSGVSGLKNHQTRMDVIGNNISNVNTTGYKSSRVTFADTLQQTLAGASAPSDTRGGTNPKQIGLGSSVASIDMIMTDGSVQSTGKNTDLCLSGNGFFVVKGANGTFYTRDGAFEFDAEGNYVLPGSGMYVQGWTADANGSINTNESIGNIVIQAGKSMGATKTTMAQYANNLDSMVATIESISGGIPVVAKIYSKREDGSVAPSDTTLVRLYLKNGIDVMPDSGGPYTVGEAYSYTETRAGKSSTVKNGETSVTVKLKDGYSFAGIDGENYSVGGNYSYEPESVTASADNEVTLKLKDGSVFTGTQGNTYMLGNAYTYFPETSVAASADNTVTYTLKDGYTARGTAGETYTKGSLLTYMPNYVTASADNTVSVTYADGKVATGTSGTNYTVGANATYSAASATAEAGKNTVKITLRDGKELTGTSGETYSTGTTYVYYPSSVEAQSGKNNVTLNFSDGTASVTGTAGNMYTIGGFYTHVETSATAQAGKNTVQVTLKDGHVFNGTDGNTYTNNDPQEYSATSVGASSAHTVTVTFADGSVIENPAGAIAYSVGGNYNYVTADEVTAQSGKNTIKVTLKDGKVLDGVSGESYKKGNLYEYEPTSITPSSNNEVTLKLSDGSTVLGTNGTPYTVGGSYGDLTIELITVRSAADEVKVTSKAESLLVKSDINKVSVSSNIDSLEVKSAADKIDVSSRVEGLSVKSNITDLEVKSDIDEITVFSNAESLDISSVIAQMTSESFTTRKINAKEQGSVTITEYVPKVDITLADGTAVTKTTGGPFTVGDVLIYNPDEVTASNENIVTVTLEDGYIITGSSGTEYTKGNMITYSPRSNEKVTASTNNVVTLTLDGSTTVTGTPGEEYQIGDTYGTSIITAISVDSKIGNISVESSIKEMNAYHLAVDANKETPTIITMSDGTTYTQTVGRYLIDQSLPVSTVITAYDTLGNAHNIPVYFTKTKVDSVVGNQWTVSVATDGSGQAKIKESDGSTTVVTMPDTVIQFDTNGKFVSGSGNVNLSLANGATGNQTVAVNLSNLTQYAGSSTVAVSANGNAMGTLSSVSFDSSGIITGTYTNGIKRQEAQVAIAQFNNSAGLTKTGTSLYQESNNSGIPNVKTATDLGVTITPSSLEMSNVDIANEFSEMITTQRGFQANSKIITVSDEMLETLVNMKR